MSACTLGGSVRMIARCFSVITRAFRHSALYPFSSSTCHESYCKRESARKLSLASLTSMLLSSVLTDCRSCLCFPGVSVDGGKQSSWMLPRRPNFWTPQERQWRTLHQTKTDERTGLSISFSPTCFPLRPRLSLVSGTTGQTVHNLSSMYYSRAVVDVVEQAAQLLVGLNPVRQSY